MSIQEVLLAAPVGQMDESLKVLIRKWSDPPKALEILEVLDLAIHGALASGVAVKTLQIIYDVALKEEGLTHEGLVPQATWRTELGG